MKIETRGGAISGNCEIGSLFIASNPKNTMAIDNEIANTGRWINRVNIIIRHVSG